MLSMILGFRSQSPPSQIRDRNSKPFRRDDQEGTHTRREAPLGNTRTDSRRSEVLLRQPYDAPRGRLDTKDPSRDVEPPARRLREYDNDIKIVMPPDVKRRRLDERTADSTVVRRNLSPSQMEGRKHYPSAGPYPENRMSQSYSRDDASEST